MDHNSSLLEALTNRDHSSVRLPCGLGSIIQSVSEEESSAISGALESIAQDHNKGRAKVYSYEWLAEVLSNHGHPVSSSTIARHMKGRCGCD